MKLRKYVAMGLAVIAPLSLSGCLILPGEFTSEMTIMKSGEFSFNYKGEIQLVGLANLLNSTLNEAASASSTTFEATCYVGSGDDEPAEDIKKKKSEEKKKLATEKSYENQTKISSMQRGAVTTAASATAEEDYDVQDEDAEQEDAVDAAPPRPAGEDDYNESEAGAAAAAAGAEASDYDLEERDCTAKEIAEQKKEWDEAQSKRVAKETEQKQLFSALLGGIDPKDPKTIDRFTKEVERLAAWNKVEHLGNGLFKIDYSTKGQLADDFAFPVIPRYSLGQPMVHITRWDKGSVRIEAPSFHTDSNFSMMAMMGGGAMMGMGGGGPKTDVKPVEPKGTFTLKTDATILANNTEEGPATVAGLSTLTWEISPKTYGPPMALLKLVN
jgi:hypothetical protein